VRVFELTVASTGASEKTLKRLKMAYRAAYLHPNNHAGYYPGAQAICLKVLFDPLDGRVLGAQAVGGEGVDKRIDILSLAIQTDRELSIETLYIQPSPRYIRPSK
jgi:NADPH-dependent 2,4-dienoyl-CoA reductase/sulfur reductase-like enzyme